MKTEIDIIHLMENFNYIFPDLNEKSRMAIITFLVEGAADSYEFRNKLIKKLEKIDLD